MGGAVNYIANKADAGAFAFQHCVGRHGRAVEEDLDIGRRDPGAGADRLDANQNAFRAVVRG